jgi:hypothetical protein
MRINDHPSLRRRPTALKPKLGVPQLLAITRSCQQSRHRLCIVAPGKNARGERDLIDA